MQAIYAKDQAIHWGDPDLRQKLVVRLGEFHTVMSFLGMIGKRFQSSGLEDILIESGVVAPGSIRGPGVMNGKIFIVFFSPKPTTSVADSQAFSK